MAADGKGHAVNGQPDYDAVAVRVVNARTVQFTYKKDRKTVHTETDTVSSDGAQLRASQRILKGDKPFNAGVVLVRESGVPQGSHALSGTWRMQQMRTVSDVARTFTYESTDDGLDKQP